MGGASSPPGQLVFPIAQAQSYERALREVSDEFAQRVIDAVLRQYTTDRRDAGEAQILALIRSFEDVAKDVAERNRLKYEAQGRAIARNQQRQLESQIQAALGVNINTVSRRVRRELELMISNNVDLITRANLDLLRQVEDGDQGIVSSRAPGVYIA